MCPMPACRSATMATRSPSRSAGQPGSSRAISGVTSSRGSRHAAWWARPPAAATPKRVAAARSSASQGLLLVRRRTSMSPPMSSNPPPVVPLPNPEPISSSSAVSNAGAEPAEALAVVEPELRGELVALEQGHVVDAAGERLRRLDLDRAVALEPGRRRNQLADDHVLLEAARRSILPSRAASVQHLRRLLERRRREERVRRQRGLGDAEDDLLERRRSRRRTPPPPRSAPQHVPVDELARQVARVALLVDADLLEHLAHDQLRCACR